MPFEPGANAGGVSKPDVQPEVTATAASDPSRWVDEHGDVLYRYALERVRKPDIAQDLVQETFLAAVRTIDRFRGGSTVRSWLCGILKHKICDYYRHMNGPKEWKPEADEVMHRDEFWKTMRDCLAKLPERVATVFMMREMDEVESKEICATLSISDSNLWVMLHRARMALRECLAMNWFENPGVHR